MDKTALMRTLLQMTIISWLALMGPMIAVSQEADEASSHAHHSMTVDTDGVVMNENRTVLPRDCLEISEHHQFTVHAGRKYAGVQPGTIFGMSEHEIQVTPCSLVEITFINEDSVRHQWMVHGLPKYLYPAGMFHIEVGGGKRKSGALIVPGGDHTYLIHCDLAQHMEKGMRGQLIVGKGNGDLWGIPAVSDDFYRSSYFPDKVVLMAIFSILIGIIFGAIFLNQQKPGKR